MKYIIKMQGWTECLQKVSLTKLQMDILGKSLLESKSNVDLLLDGKKIVFKDLNKAIANEFVLKAKNIGVICDIEIDSSGNKVLD